MLCIANGIVHGVTVQFHTHHLLCVVGGGQADGSDAAVGIQHHFFAGEMRRVHRKAVQHFGLGMIDLVKTAWAERIRLAAKLVQNEALAVQHLFHIAQHHAGFAVVHVLDDGGDGHTLLSGFGQQGFDKVPGTRQHRLSRHQHHHHLPGHNTAPQQAVTQKAGALILIERLVMAGARCRTASMVLSSTSSCKRQLSTGSTLWLFAA